MWCMLVYGNNYLTSHHAEINGMQKFRFRTVPTLQGIAAHGNGVSDSCGHARQAGTPPEYTFRDFQVSNLSV